MENSNQKTFDKNRIENFLNKVKNKLNTGVEEIGINNEKILDNWLVDIKNNSENSLQIKFKETFYNEFLKGQQEIEEFNPTTITDSDNNNNLDEFYTNFEIYINPNLTHLEKNQSSEYFNSRFLNIKFNDEEIKNIQEFLIENLNVKNEWEILNAILQITITILESKNNFNIDNLIENISQNFNKLIQHPEYRLRTLLTKLIKNISMKLSDQNDITKIQFYFNNLLKDIFRNFNIEDKNNHHCDNTNKQCEHIISNNNIITLDTSKNILIELLNTIKSTKINLIDEKTLEEFISYLDNQNKGVRIASYEILQGLINYLFNKDEEIKHNLNYLKTNFIVNVLQKLNFTLIDFYGQVRFASLNFLQELNQFSIKKLEIQLLKEKYFFVNILPKICCNRYIPIEGVKKSSLNLWKEIVNLNGIKIIKENFENFLSVYLIEMTSKSHTARESACRCLQELIMKVYDQNLHYEFLIKKMNLIIDLLSNCIKDACWNVREAALNSSGYILKLFYNQNSEFLQTFLDLIWLHLFDNIIEVRDSASFAIRIFATSFTQEYNKDIIYKIKNLILELNNQNSIQLSYDKFKYDIFEMVKNQNNLPDLGFIREIELWEYVDAIIHLVKELSDEENLFVPLGITIDELIVIISDYFFKNYNSLQNLAKKTFWQCFSSLFKKLKKAEVDMYLDMILDILVKELKNNSNNLCGFEAENFLIKLSEITSKKYIKNKLKNYDPNILIRIEELLNNPN